MNKLKAATIDLTKEISQWVLWYLLVLTLIIVIVAIFVGDPELGEASYMEVVNSSNRVFVFVVGILITFFYFDWLFKMGITRKKYFKILSLTSLNIILILTVASFVLSYIMAVIPWFETGMPSVTVFFVSFIVHYVVFLLGSAIGIGFYRSVKTGMAIVGLAVLLMGGEILLDVFNYQTNIYHGIGAVLVGILLFYLNYKMVYRIPVKM